MHIPGQTRPGTPRSAPAERAAPMYSHRFTEAGDSRDPSDAPHSFVDVRRVAPDGGVRRCGIRRAQSAAVRSAVSDRRQREQLLALLSPGTPPGTVRLELAGTRPQHLRVRHAVVRPAPQQGPLSGQRGLGLPSLVTDLRGPLRRRQVAACDGAARMPRLHRPVGVHGVQRLHSRALRPPRHAARRCPHARQRVDFRARHLGTGRRAHLRRPALRGGGVRHAGGALSRRRLALGGRPRPASRGRRVGSRQRLPPAVVVVVRHSAGRPGHSTSSQACVPELAAVAGRVVHCPGSGRLRGARRGQPGGDDARAPSRHLPVVGRVVRGHAVGRRRLPCRATGTDAQGPGRVERAGTPDVHALRHRSRARRRILDEHCISVERNRNHQPFDVLGLETHGRPLSAPDLVPEAPGVLHAGRTARRYVGGGPLRLRRRHHSAGLLVRRLVLRVRPRAGPVGPRLRVHEPLEPETAAPPSAFLRRVHSLCMGAPTSDHGRRRRSGSAPAFVPGNPAGLRGTGPDDSPGLEARLFRHRRLRVGADARRVPAARRTRIHRPDSGRPPAAVHHGRAGWQRCRPACRDRRRGPSATAGGSRLRDGRRHRLGARRVDGVPHGGPSTRSC